MALPDTFTHAETALLRTLADLTDGQSLAIEDAALSHAAHTLRQGGVVQIAEESANRGWSLTTIGRALAEAHV